MAQPRRQSYVLSQDDPEKERLEKQHEGLVEMQHGTIIHAPFRAGQRARILDIGCGTGSVTLELARLFPKAQVVGVDLSDMQKEEQPPNVKYLHGDFNLLMGGSSLKPESFDYTYHRALAFGLRNWHEFVSNVYSLLKPGGYSEMHEFDFRYRRHSRVIDDEFDHKRAMNEMLRADGYDICAGDSIEKYMLAAGFVDVHVCGRYKAPFGEWMTDTNPETAKIGRINMEDNITAMQGVLARVLSPAGYPTEEIDRLKRDVNRLRDTTGLSVDFVVTVGRKPL